MASIFGQIDKALGRYYDSLGRTGYFNEDGKGKFLQVCESEGFEDEEEVIDDELDGDMEDCMMLEFDVNFPFTPEYQHKNEEEQKQFIFDLLKQCYKNPQITFDDKHKKAAPKQIKTAPKQQKAPPKAEEKDAFYSPQYIEYIQKNKRIKLVCDNLRRYYISIRKPYDCIFSIFCQDNGVSDGDLDGELKQNANECLLTEFDDDFPFDAQLSSYLETNEEQKQSIIIELIKKCYGDNAQCTFDQNLPQCFFIDTASALQYLYEITRNEFESVTALYQRQCSTLWNAGMDDDKGFLYMMAIGRKFNFNYLQYLMSSYYRDRIQDINKPLHKKQWSLKQDHFKALKEIKFIAPWPKEEDEKNVPCNAYQVALSAMNCFDIRCVPMFDFAKFVRINDSLEILVRYIDSAYGFIGHLLSGLSKMPICPFQVDICIGYGEPYKIKCDEVYSGDDDDDDDDNDNDDEKKQDKFINIIGDIQKKLNENGLKHDKDRLKPERASDFEYVAARHFITLYESFLEKHELQKDRGGVDPPMYLHHKRLIVFVDRRPDDDTQTPHDDIWMYEPPANCKNIPKDAVPEWSINASKTCLLPDMNYGDGSMAVNAPKAQNNTKQKLINSNVWSSFHAQGQVLTLSFAVNSSDDIKCYLYWHGQMLLFKPEHIKTIIPSFINMNWNGYDQDDDNSNINSINRRFLTENGIDEIIKRMQKVIH